MTLNLLKFASKHFVNNCSSTAIGHYAASRQLLTLYTRSFYHMESASGPVQLKVEEKLKVQFNPTYLEVVNESYKHSVPKGSETHFKVVIVSELFKGQTPIQRHRSVNGILADELSGPIHALSIQAKTPSQWEASGKVVANTPPCLGGSKADKQK